MAGAKSYLAQLPFPQVVGQSVVGIQSVLAMRGGLLGLAEERTHLAYPHRGYGATLGILGFVPR